MDATAQTTTALIPASQVPWLVREARLEVAAHSPLAAFLQAPPAAERPSPAIRRDLDAAWVSALHVLSSPAHCVRTVAVGPARSLVATYYRARGGGPLAGCWLEDGQVRFVFDQQPSYFIRAASRMMGADTPAPLEPVAVELSHSGVLAFAAVIDALRSRLFASLLARRPADDEAAWLSLDDVQLSATRGGTAGDARWMVTLWQTLVPAGAYSDRPQLDEGLDELVARKWITRFGIDRVQPLPPLPRLAWLWKVPLPAFSTAVLSRRPDGSDTERHLLAWRGEGPIFTLERSAAPGVLPRAMIRAATGRDYVRRLDDLLRHTAGHAQAACANPACAKPLRPGARFCPSCGSPVQGA